MTGVRSGILQSAIGVPMTRATADDSARKRESWQMIAAILILSGSPHMKSGKKLLE